MKIDDTLEHIELGKPTIYSSEYDPTRLFPILRQKKRSEIGIDANNLPFFGIDQWSHFEVSWLNSKGKPIVAIAEIIFDANSTYLIESKSMKLYFNSFNNTQFLDFPQVAETIKGDLQNCIDAEVTVKVIPLAQFLKQTVYSSFEGNCLDFLDIECDQYRVDPRLLMIEEEDVEETLYSDLLRSNCLVTGQPDWGSVQIAYQGKKINPASLLRYIVSYRNHTEFGEHCVERIFMDILLHCKPTKLAVYGRYTRRGGIDINCYRSTHQIINASLKYRLARQ